MRRLAAFTLLLLLLQSLGAGAVLAQVSGDTTHAHCGAAVVTAAPAAHASGHAADESGGGQGDHCSMPWMTGCAASSSCSVQAMRAASAPAEMAPRARPTGHHRVEPAPDSPASELEAPPPRD